MKRISFCTFALLFWLIAFSTLFSIRVEQWMTPVVTVTGANKDDELPLNCLQWEDETIPHLFRLEEGTEWSPGTRAKEYSAANYAIMPENLLLDFSYGMEFIQFSTKEVEEGGLVEEQSGKTEPLPDWFLVFQEEDSEPSLREMDQVDQPFMENREISKLEADRIYSMNELTGFFGALLLLSIIPAEFFFLLGLWSASLRLAKAPPKNRNILGVNILIALLLLGSVPLLLNAVTPAQSLLPHDVIVEIGHYTHEFSEIFPALQRFAAEGDATADAILSQTSIYLWASLGILLAGIGLGVGVFFLETARKPRKKSAPRHAVSN